MKQIDFHFNVKNRSRYVCRLIKKVVGLGLSVAVWSTDEVYLKMVYDDLWRFEDMTVIPHAWAGSSFENEVRVVFSCHLLSLGKKDVVVLLDDHVPEHWQSDLVNFDRVVDIVSTREDELKDSRVRYRVYKSANVTINAYDRSNS